MKIDDETLADLVSLAIGAYPNEACALIGKRRELATTIYPCRNAARNPRSTFLVAPEDQRQAMTEMHKRFEVLGAIFHSHPHGRAHPSGDDLHFAVLHPHTLQILVAVDEDELRFWRVPDGNGELVEVFRDPSTQEVTREIATPVD